MIKKTTLFFIICLLITGSYAQSIGEWRMHINYNNTIGAAASNSKIVAANAKSILVYDFNDNDVRTLDKVKGLSDYGVNVVAHDDLTNTFIIAYSSSNIDFLKGNTIINFPDIKNKIIAGSKNINHIYCKEGKAYVSTDFGIVVINLEKEEVENTYVIGETGNQTIVQQTAISNDTLYAVTVEGLKSAYLETSNLLDFSQWNHNLYSQYDIKEINSFNDTLFALSDTSFYKYFNGDWTKIYTSDSNTLNHLYTSDALTFVDGMATVIKYSDNLIDTVSTPYSIAPNACFEINGNFYLGDYSFGLFKNGNKVFNFSSPFSNDAFRALSVEDKMIITSGAFTSNLDGKGFIDGFYIFEDNNWINHNIYSTIGTNQPSQDLNYLAYNDFNKKVYIAMFKGLIEFDFNNSVNIYNNTNSPIDSFQGNPTVQIISGVDVDDKGNVWMVNPGTDKAVKVLDIQGNWHELSIQDDGSKYYGLFIDKNNQKWIRTKNNGVRVYQEGEDFSNVGAKNILLSTITNNGNLPNANANCIAEDKDGEIWIGTDEGIAIFTCPENIFDASTDCRVSSRITSTVDLYTEYLFETDKVYAIEVDGANRKWVGTSSGLWLLSEDGKDVIYNFNTENSPLPSTEIFDVKINKNSGEVFVLTNNGFVSYVSDATDAYEDYSEIKAYPNPVRPNYTGYISITGLVDNSFVKITDEHGVLVDEGYALGGKYIWDGNDYNGRRANSGVYYVFTANDLATQKAVTKIAFVR